ncbi:MAG: hypothetical protein ACI4SR_00095 [Faecalibacillus sp.]
MKLVYDNYLQYGILEDIDDAIDLSEEIYVSNYFEVIHDDKGMIQKIYRFLYEKDSTEKTRTYLVDYDVNKSKSIKFYLNGYAYATYHQS